MALALSAAITLRPSIHSYDRASTGKGAQPLSIHYFGTSTLALVRDGEALVIDGFFSRPSLVKLAQPLRPDTGRIEGALDGAGIQKVSAVLVGHSHYDHALDAASVARTYGGEVWGTYATARIAAAEGFQHSRVLMPSVPEIAGGAVVTPFSLRHSPGGRAMGDVARAFTVPARVGDYRFGRGLGFHIHSGDCRIMVVPSAGLPEQDLSGLRSDVVFLAIGQLGLQDTDYIRRYWDSVVVASGAKWVLPTHWDDFTRSLDRSLVPLPYAVDRIDKAIAALSMLAGDGIEIVMPVSGAAMDLPPLRQCSG
ncbi:MULTISPECIES: MBL fold metallo-hydrolase [unclassified Brevundimonas]|uniref:MBL fold metallo-hydrolase n=1 Tax=unclassified Brevundimonas TaxID=2622653 RepID=UPI0025BF2215|nr:MULTISPECIES: MBL fold metallo-hydrolase [unclassified Brevundimonas]